VSSQVQAQRCVERVCSRVLPAYTVSDAGTVQRSCDNEERCVGTFLASPNCVTWRDAINHMHNFELNMAVILTKL